MEFLFVFHTLCCHVLSTITPADILLLRARGRGKNPPVSKAVCRSSVQVDAGMLESGWARSSYRYQESARGHQSPTSQHNRHCCRTRAENSPRDGCYCVSLDYSTRLPEHLRSVDFRGSRVPSPPLASGSVVVVRELADDVDAVGVNAGGMRDESERASGKVKRVSTPGKYAQWDLEDRMITRWAWVEL